MTKYTKGLVIALSLTLALTMVGCSSESSAPKEPAQTNQTAPAETEKAPEAEKAPETTPVAPEKAPETTPTTGTNPTPAPAAGGPELEEEACDC